jgi:hypothetical protein
MKLKDIIESGCGIVVTNRDEYDKLAKMLDEAGLKWCSDKRYTEYSPVRVSFPIAIIPKDGKWDHEINNYEPITLSDIAEEDELERLRKENAELKAQLSQQQPKDEWPKVRDKYFICNMAGIGVLCTWNDGVYDNAQLSIGNVHRTKEAAEAWFERKQLEHKMNEGGKVQVYYSELNQWRRVACTCPHYGSFKSANSAEDFLSDPENIELLNKHFK